MKIRLIKDKFGYLIIQRKTFFSGWEQITYFYSNQMSEAIQFFEEIKNKEREIDGVVIYKQEEV